PGAPQAPPPRPHTGGDGRNFTSRPGPWVDSHGDRSGPPPQGDRRAPPEGQGSRDWRGYTGGPYDGRAGRPPQVDSWGGDHRDRGDHRDGGDHGDRGGHRDRGDHPQWRPGAYPHSYPSYHRYHVRPYFYPPHWFAHDWMFGEFLPEAWFAPQYLIEDWWDFGLPEPPYGYDWVRVGTDALLIDEYDGRIVQVVRYVFW
ncbi:MAG: RcnB family protein, partial [Alphaproteobacteria bacterium]|nr:RcnB family protein [Alphaproteobacteria bacterium]